MADPGQGSGFDIAKNVGNRRERPIRQDIEMKLAVGTVVPADDPPGIVDPSRLRKVRAREVNRREAAPA